MYIHALRRFRQPAVCILFCLSFALSQADPLLPELPSANYDSLLTAWSGRDIPDDLLLRGHLAELEENSLLARSDWLSFLDRYPFHPHTSYIHYRLGRNYAAHGEWQAAADQLLPLLTEVDDKRLTKRVETAFCELYQRLSPEEGKQLLELLPVMIETARRTETRWRSPSIGDIDIGHEMMRTTFDIIVETMMSDSENRTETFIASNLKKRAPIERNGKPQSLPIGSVMSLIHHHY